MTNNIDVIFNNISILLNEYLKNDQKINVLIDKIIEMVIEENHVDYILKNVKIILKKIYNNINDDNKDYYKNYINKLTGIKKYISKINSDNSITKNDIDILKYLIYIDRDINRISCFFSKNINSLINNKECDIFYDILNSYINANNNNEIDYLYMIIILFLKNDTYKDYIMNNKYKYLLLLNKYNNKPHIKELINKFSNDYSVSLEELENKYKIKFIYPKDIEIEMYGFKFDNNNRYDFTNQRVITIDHDTDTCLDDAIYIEKNIDDTYTLYVHITDIAGVIPYNSNIFYEAIKMGETLYLMDKVISIYPDYISNKLCSILPNNKRNVITYKVILDNNYDILDFKILKGKILCKDRLSYESANEILKGNTIDRELYNILLYLFNFSHRQRCKNKKKDMYREYHKFIDSNNIINTKSDLIVSECMILINHLASKYFYCKGYPYINRTLHLCNKEEGLIKLNKIFNNLKIGTLGINDLKEGEILWIYNKIKETFSRAKYSVNEYKHDGLGYEYYSRTTSPARRVSDAINQHLTYDFIFNNNINDNNIYLWEDRLKEIVDYLNKRKINNDIFSSQYNHLISKKLLKNKNNFT